MIFIQRLFSNKEIKNSFNFYLNSRQNLKLSEICEFIKQYLVEVLKFLIRKKLISL